MGMKLKKNKISVVLLLCVLLLVGCGKGQNNNQSGNVTSMGYTTDPSDDDEDELNSVAIIGSEETKSDNELPDLRDVCIYTISYDGTETMDSVLPVTKDTEITPEYIVQLVVADMADKSYVIEVNDVSVENDNVVVDFKKTSPPLVDVGFDVETAMLDAFAFSIIDNVSECNGIIYRCEGKEYNSMNQSFEFDQIYLAR